MSDLHLSIGKETTEYEEKILLESFDGLNIGINKGIIRLAEDELPMIITFSINAIVGGILWDTVKTSIQRLRQKEDKEIKRKIVQKISYKKQSIFVSKDSIYFSNEHIKIKTIDDAINEIDKNT